MSEWKLVPVEPTEDITSKLAEALRDILSLHEILCLDYAPQALMRADAPRAALAEYDKRKGGA